MKRVLLNSWWFVLAALATLAGSAQAQDTFPDRPVKLIVPVAAGGGVDTAFRTIAPYWGELLGQTVVVENRPGAGQVIGIDAVAKSKPDGYTLGGVGVPIAFNTALGRKLPYDPLTDLVPIAEVVTQPLIVVGNPALPAKNLKELIDGSRKQASPLLYTSGGVGSYGHLWFEMVGAQERVGLQHVAYSGVAPALKDVLGGQVLVLVDALVPSGTQVKAGKLRGLAIVRATRSTMLPDVPTLKEQGINLPDAAPFYGVIGPAGLPVALRTRLNDTLARALRNPALQAKLADMGFDVVGGSAEDYGKKIRSEIELWGRIVRDNQIKVE
ncbi:MAG: tripartite tricarboxylate transporter substrate binding protein [Burkholderiaceae bacterium]